MLDELGFGTYSAFTRSAFLCVVRGAHVMGGPYEGKSTS